MLTYLRGEARVVADLIRERFTVPKTFGVVESNPVQDAINRGARVFYDADGNPVLNPFDDGWVDLRRKPTWADNVPTTERKRASNPITGVLSLCAVIGVVAFMLASLVNPFGAGSREWARKTAAKIAVTMATLGSGELLVDEKGNVYGGDGATAVQALQRLMRIGELTYNVRDYGAKGDGTADDTTAAQSALTAANAAGGGRVFFPKGDYLITTTLTAGSYVIIEGTGRKSRIFSTTNKLNLVIALSTVGTTAKHLLFEGNGTGSQPTNVSSPALADFANAGSGLIFAGVVGGRVEDCAFINLGGNMSDSDHNGVAGIWATYGCQNCVFTKNYATTCRSGFNEDNYYNVTPSGNRWTHNTAISNVFGLAVDGVTKSLMDHNVCQSNVQTGISSIRSSYVTIDSNVCESNGASQTNCGIQVYSSGAVPSTRHVVIGNICRANGTHGIKISDGAREVNVQGNNCNSNFRDGIVVTGASDVTVLGNVCVDNSLQGSGLYHGIEIISSDHVLVEANKSKSSGATSALNQQGYGLFCSGTSDYIRVTDGNDFTGNVTGTMVLVGANSRVGPHTAEILRSEGQGLKGETFTRLSASASFVPAGGRCIGVLVGLRAGVPVTGLVVQSTVAGSGVTLFKGGIANAGTGVLLASSTDQHAAVNAAAGLIDLPLSAVYYPPTDGDYLFEVISVGTTAPTLIMSGVSSIASIGTIGLVGRAGKHALTVSMTGQTDLPATHSLAAAAGAVGVWIGWY